MEPRIYVACLASYNAGKLYGAWIDANQGPDEIAEDIHLMLAKSPESGAEEWAIHDSEGFEGIKIGESTDLNTITLHASMIDEHGGAWSAYVGNVGEHYATVDGFEESYRGTYRSAEDFAEELLNDCGDLQSIPERLRNYFDFESFARDMVYDGWSFIEGGDGVYVFSPE